MKTLKRNSRTLSCSPPRMLSPSMAHVNAACRKDFVSFIRKVFHVLNPSAKFYMNWHICRIAYVLEQVRLGKIKRADHHRAAALHSSPSCVRSRSRLLFWATIRPSA